MQRPWRLVGRDGELALLGGLIALGEPPHGALVVAPAGTGKTALVNAVAARDGRQVHRLVGTPSSQPIPLGAATGWVRARPDMDPTTILQTAVDACLGDLTDADQRLLVTVDDAHLLDPLTAILVHRLALTGRVDVLLTLRADQAAPEAVSAMVKDGLVVRTDLPPLDEAAVQALLTEVLGGPVEAHSLRRLMGLADGNLLMLRELVDGEVESGGLAPTDGIWYSRGRPTSLQPSIVDLLRARLADAPDRAREVCELLALAEPLPVALLAEMVDERSVEHAEELQLIAVTGIPDDTGPLSAQLHHPLYGEALRSALPHTRARRLRGELLAMLDRRGPPEDEVASLQRAVLRLDSDAPVDPGQCLVAAAVAGGMFDFALAERLAAAAASAGAGPLAEVARAGAVIRQGRVEEASEMLTAVLAAEPDEPARIAAGGLLSCIEFWVRADNRRARTRIAELLDTVTVPALRAHLIALDACFSFFDGEGDRAREQGTWVLRESTAPPSARAWACAAVGISEALAGRFDRARAVYAEGDRLVEELSEDRYVRLPLGNGEMLMLGLAGELARARKRSLAHERSTYAAPGGEISAAGSFFRGQVEWWCGDLSAASDHLRNALTELADFDSAGWTEQALIVLAQVLAARGDLDGMQQALARLEQSPRGVYASFEPQRRLAKAWADAASGNVHTAAARALGAAECAAGLGQRAVESLCLHAAVRWGDTTGLARLEELAGEVPAPRPVLAAAHARALAAADPGALDDCAQRWLDLGARLLAADCAAQAARLHRSNGDDGAAHAAAHLARDLAERAGAVLPAVDDLGTGGRLTTRERQVATLAANGLSNSAIAEQLVLSTRTVEGHLLRAYDKLGVHRRADLPTVLHPSRTRIR